MNALHDIVTWLAEAPAAVLFMLDVALKATLILGLAAAVMLIMRHASASARHFTWSLAIAALLLLPVFATVLPAWNVGLLNVAQVEAPAAPTPPPAPDAPVVAPLPAGPPPATLPSAPPPPEVLPSVVPQAITPPAATPPTATPPTATPPTAAPSGVRNAGLPMSAWILLLWGAGVVAVLARWGMGALGVWWMKRRALPVEDSEWAKLTDRLSRDLGLNRPVELLQSPWATMPMTWGLMRPNVLLPVDASTWSNERRRVVLLHELAHVKRYDSFTQTLTQLACAVHWFNPLVWISARRLRIERERACDDLVLTAGTKASAYAGHVLDIAQSFRGGRLAALSTVAMANRSQLEGRLLAILNPKLRRGRLSVAATALTWMTALMLILPLAAMRPFTPVLTEAEVVESEGVEAEAVTMTADPEEVVRYDGSAERVADRWAWAEEEAETRGFDDSYWVGYSIERMMGRKSFVGSMSWSNGRRVRDGKTLYEILTGETQPEDFDIGDDDELVSKEVAFLFDLQPDGTVQNVKISNVSLNARLGDQPLIWLGMVDDEASLDFVTDFYETLSSAEMKEDFMAAIAMHENKSRVVDELTTVLKSDEPSDVREQAAFWIGQQDDEQGLETLIEAAQSDRSGDVREQAVFAISQVELEASTDALIDLARNADDQEVREKATFWLGQQASDQAAEALVDIAYTGSAAEADRDQAAERQERAAERQGRAAERQGRAARQARAAQADTTDDEKVEMMKQALHALAQLDDDRGADKLVEIARTHPNKEIRSDALFWLSQTDADEAGALLLSVAFEDPDPELQERAVFGLSQLDDDEAADALIRVADTHPEPETRRQAIFWLGQTDHPEAAEVLLRYALEDEDDEVQEKAVHAISQLDEDLAVPMLTRLANAHPDSKRRADAIFWLGQTEGVEAAETLERFAFEDGEVEVQEKAIFALSQLDEDGLDALIRVARSHPNGEMRKKAVFWLGESGDERALDVLIEIIENNR